MKSILRSKFQNKMHFLTSNKKGFPTEEDLNEASRYSYKKKNHTYIKSHINKKLKSPKKKWRKILKTFYLIENLLYKGCKELVYEFKKKIKDLEKFFNFEYFENNMDRGLKSFLKSS